MKRVLFASAAIALLSTGVFADSFSAGIGGAVANSSSTSAGVAASAGANGVGGAAISLNANSSGAFSGVALSATGSDPENGDVIEYVHFNAASCLDEPNSIMRILLPLPV